MVLQAIQARFDPFFNVKHAIHHMDLSCWCVRLPNIRYQLRKCHAVFATKPFSDSAEKLKERKK